jgi:hypothetical protein
MKEMIALGHHDRNSLAKLAGSPKPHANDPRTLSRLPAA